MSMLGANQGNSTLTNIQRALDQRYGPSQSVAEFAAQSSDGALREHAGAV